jgi:hypothetical protein
MNLSLDWFYTTDLLTLIQTVPLLTRVEELPAAAANIAVPAAVPSPGMTDEAKSETNV